MSKINLKKITSTLIQHHVTGEVIKESDVFLYPIIINPDKIVCVQVTGKTEQIARNGISVRCHMTDRIHNLYDTVAYRFTSREDLDEFISSLPFKPECW